MLKNLIARGLHENALELLKVIPRNHLVNSERVTVPEVEFMRQLVLSIQVKHKSLIERFSLTFYTTRFIVSFQEPKLLVSMLKKVDEAMILKSPYELALNFSYGKHDKGNTICQ